MSIFQRLYNNIRKEIEQPNEPKDENIVKPKLIGDPFSVEQPPKIIPKETHSMSESSSSSEFDDAPFFSKEDFNPKLHFTSLNQKIKEQQSMQTHRYQMNRKPGVVGKYFSSGSSSEGEINDYNGNSRQMNQSNTTKAKISQAVYIASQKDNASTPQNIINVQTGDSSYSSIKAGLNKQRVITRSTYQDAHELGKNLYPNIFSSDISDIKSANQVQTKSVKFDHNRQKENPENKTQTSILKQSSIIEGSPVKSSHFDFKINREVPKYQEFAPINIEYSEESSNDEDEVFLHSFHQEKKESSHTTPAKATYTRPSPKKYNYEPSSNINRKRNEVKHGPVERKQIRSPPKPSELRQMNGSYSSSNEESKIEKLSTSRNYQEKAPDLRKGQQYPDARRMDSYQVTQVKYEKGKYKTKF